MTDPSDSITLTRGDLEREIATWLVYDMPLCLFKFMSHICPNDPPDIKTRAILEESLTNTLFTNAKARDNEKLATSRAHDAVVEEEMQAAWEADTHREEPKR